MTLTLLINVGAIMHLRVMKMSSANQLLLEQMGTNTEPTPARRTVKHTRYNPTLLQGISEAFIVLFLMAPIFYMIKSQQPTKLFFLYSVQLIHLFIYVIILAACFFTKKPLRMHIWTILRLTDNAAVVPYVTNQ